MIREYDEHFRGRDRLCLERFIITDENNIELNEEYKQRLRDLLGSLFGEENE